MRRARHTVRVEQCILDRNFHIRHAHLTAHSIILVLHSRMQHALTVYHDLDLRRVKVKQPLGFDEFQTLIHQGRRVDRDLIAHVPVGMLEGIGSTNGFQLCLGLAEERTAGGCQDDLADAVHAVSLQALENRRMLGIDRVNIDALLRRILHDKAAACHEGLLVGESDVCTCLDRFERRQQAHHADHGIEEDIMRLCRCDLAESLHTGEDLSVLITEQVTQLLHPGRVKEADSFRVVLLCLLSKAFHIMCSRNRCHLHPVLIDHIERLCSDGTR